MPCHVVSFARSTTWEGVVFVTVDNTPPTLRSVAEGSTCVPSTGTQTTNSSSRKGGFRCLAWEGILTASCLPLFTAAEYTESTGGQRGGASSSLFVGIEINSANSSR